MRNIIFIAFAVFLTACAFSGTYLEPPAANTTPSNMNADMNECLFEANKPVALSQKDIQLIEGKETVRFFMNGRRVVTPGGKPALHQSLIPRLYKTNGLSNRYAVCLIRRGYNWAER